jgi:predicted transcriptional regulator
MKTKRGKIESVWLEEDMANRVQQAAEAEYLSKSAWIRQTIARRLEEEYE